MSRLASLLAMSEKVTRERERRLILHMLPPECAEARRVRIEQGFIKEVRQSNQPHCDVRIRREGMNKYSMTAKFRPRKQECTTAITREVHEALWTVTKSKQYKERYFLNNGWIVDDVLRPDRMVVAEFEYKGDRQHCVVPPTFKVKQDLGVQ